MNSIYTIGHSNQDMVAFLKLLKDNSIQVVVDVRSAPYSRYVPQFNKKEMELQRHIPVWHIRSDDSRIRAKEHLEEYSTQLKLF